MNNRIFEALDEIKAQQQMKENTYIFLQNKVYKKAECSKNLPFKKFAVVFASLMILFTAGLFSYNLYAAETAFLDIDVNPSIEVVLNRFDRVIGVHAYNEEGEQLINSINIKHKPYKNALKIIIDKMSELGYIDNAEMFTATLLSKDTQSQDAMLSSLKEYINSVFKADESLKKEVFCIDSDTKTHAHENNLSPAKYLAIKELQEVDPNVTIDECRSHSIGEIKEQTHAHMNAGKHKGNGNTHGTETTSESAGHTESEKHGGSETKSAHSQSENVHNQGTKENHSNKNGNHKNH